MDLAVGGHAEQAKPEAAAEVAKARVVLAALAANGHACGEPDLVARGHPVYPLEDKFEIELQLQFANDHDGRRIGAQCEQVAAADLALDHESQAFEKPFYRAVKRGFEHVCFLSESWSASSPVLNPR